MNTILGIHNYPSFVAAIVAFQIIPGPGTLAILNATARHGVRSGMGALVGTLTGDLVFMLGAIVGLAAILAARPVLFSSLQWLGIAYLCWVGLRLLRKPVAEGIERAARAPQEWTCFRQAFAVCLTNPKTSNGYTLGVRIATPDEGDQNIFRIVCDGLQNRSVVSNYQLPKLTEH
jgi:threonine/homoserine/homoserine lactone efflux protein